MTRSDSSASPQDTKRDHGQHAQSPSEIPARGWWDITKRVASQSGEDHTSLVAAGVAFYGFLALFPAMIAVVSVYGLVTDPVQVEQNLNTMLGIMPSEAHDLLSEQLHELTTKSDESLGFGVLFSVLLAFWSANKGTKALFEGLNIAYDETAKRGFLRENGITLAFTLATAVLGLVAIFMIAIFGALLEYLRWPAWIEGSLSLLRWILLAGLVLVMLATLYKFAPVRNPPKIRWISVGSLLALVLWLAASVGFSYYVSNFGSYDETYGSLAAVVIFLLWIYLSAYIVLLGAEVNSEMEHQTVVDSTTGPAEPMGDRGAYHADHVAEVKK